MGEKQVDFKQRTVRDDVSCTGIGLHSGQKVRLTVKPAPPDTGIKFIRKDASHNRAIKAHFDNVVDTHLSTTIGCNGTRVSTIEHLMATFFGLGIDNARVEIDGPEVPIMDGSSAPFVFLLKSVGIREQKKPKSFIVLKKTLRVREGNKSIAIHPANELKISYTIDFNHPMIKEQKYDLHFSGKDFITEISRARTFGFLNDVQALREAGLGLGGSLDNAIIIDDFRVLNEDGLRYKDEFVRHKILDFLGDIAILGAPIIGHFVVEKSGHSLNQAILRKLIANRRYWERLVLDNPEECIKNRVKIPVFGSLEPIPA
ncbi:MAG: UDP-3-O-acyl-N-acetylglucosamine deacetylase [Deltaproteobacteria bacterium]|nr:UDP-3-O-acyl-N-acetylglucosamine deacetylase [Deltaproteobacteria bacterium]